VEGDNGLLPQQCAKGLIKQLSSREGYAYGPSRPDIGVHRMFELTDIDKLFGSRAACSIIKVSFHMDSRQVTLKYTLAIQLRSRLSSLPWDQCLVDATEASEAHAVFLVYKVSLRFLSKQCKKSVRSYFSRSCGNVRCSRIRRKAQSWGCVGCWDYTSW
jgi:hypothetical protein